MGWNVLHFNKFTFAPIFSPVLKLKPALWKVLLSIGGKRKEEKMQKTVFLSEKVISIFSFHFFQKTSGTSKDDLKYSSFFIKNSQELVINLGSLRWEVIL